MKITSEDVKAVQQRVDVTYEEAEKYLIRANGNIDQAVYMINQKRDSGFSRFMDEVKRIFSELLTYYFKVEKKDKVFMDIPLLIVVMFFALVNLDTKIWVLVVGIGLILLSESQVSIFKIPKQDDGLVKRAKPDHKASAASQVSAGQVSKAEQASQPSLKPSNGATEPASAADNAVAENMEYDRKQNGPSIPVPSTGEGIVSGEYATTTEAVQTGQIIGEDEDDDDYYEITIEK